MVEKAVKTNGASLENPVGVDLGKCRELTRSDDKLYIVYIFYFVLLCFRFLTVNNTLNIPILCVFGSSFCE